MYFPRIFLIFVLALCSCAEPKVKKFPREFIEYLHKAGIPLGSLLRRNRPGYLPRVSAISARRYDATTRSQALSDTPDHSNGVTTTQLHNTADFLPEALCQPRPVAIRIPKVPHVLTFPDYVILNRCTGSCPFNQEIQHCAVTARDAINVKIVEIVGHQFRVVDTVLYNHTACGCDCIAKESDCDLKKQTWNQNTCGCDCKASVSSCADNQKFDYNKCECKCNQAEKPCDHVHKEWDFTNCGCRCKAVLQKNCEAQNQHINTVTCECINVNA